MSICSRESTQLSSAYVRFVASLKTLGSSLAGSGLFVSLAVACVFFGTGMNPTSDGTANGAADASLPAQDQFPVLPPGLPVDEPVRLTSNVNPRPLDPRNVASVSGGF